MDLSALASLSSVAAAGASDLDRIADDLSKNWHPSGYYTPDQVLQIFDQMTRVFDQVVAPVRQYIKGDWSSGRNAARQLESRLMSAYAGEGKAAQYLDAVKRAKATGVKVLDLPGLRRYVVNFFVQMSAGVEGMRVLSEISSWIVSAVKVIVDVSMAAAAVVKAVVGIAIEVVKAAGAAVIAVPDMISTLVKFAKIGVLGYAGWWLYNQTRKGERA